MLPAFGLAVFLLPSPCFQGTEELRRELAMREGRLRRQVQGLRLLESLDLGAEQCRLLLLCAEMASREQERAKDRYLQNQQRYVKILRDFKREDLVDRGFSRRVEGAARRYSQETRREKTVLGEKLEYLERVFLRSLKPRQLQTLRTHIKGNPGEYESENHLTPRDRVLPPGVLGELRKYVREDRRERFRGTLFKQLSSLLGKKRIPRELALPEHADRLFSQMRKDPRRGRRLADQKLREWHEKAVTLASARKELVRTGRNLYGGYEGPVSKLLFFPDLLPSLREITNRTTEIEKRYSKRKIKRRSKG